MQLSERGPYSLFPKKKEKMTEVTCRSRQDFWGGFGHLSLASRSGILYKKKELGMEAVYEFRSSVFLRRKSERWAEEHTPRGGSVRETGANVGHPEGKNGKGTMKPELEISPERGNDHWRWVHLGRGRALKKGEVPNRDKNAGK